MNTGYIKFSHIEGNKPIIEVKTVGNTVWMTINEIADLFGVYTPTVNKHLKVIFKENLLQEKDVTKEYRYTALDGGEYIRIYYNLDAIISLSFRIQSLYTKIFREWVLNASCEYARHGKGREVILVFNSNTRVELLTLLGQKVKRHYLS